VKKVIHRIKKILKGFTIVELIIVIAIIAVFASIVTVSVAGQVNKAKDSRVKAEISEIAKGVGMYYSDHSTYDGYTAPVSFSSVCSGSSYTLSANEASAFVVYAKLCTSGSYWCADSTGSVKEIENPPDADVHTCTSGSGIGGEAGTGNCGEYPECSEGFICYNNSECVQCGTLGCNFGEDCRCDDCACSVGELCKDNGGSYVCSASSSIETLLVSLQTAFNNYYMQNQTYYAYCSPYISGIYPITYNYPELNEIADTVRGYDYSFMCAESDESPEGSACYYEDYLNTRWYAIACNNSDSNDCLCTDSYSSMVAGTRMDLESAGLSNCSCY